MKQNILMISITFITTVIMVSISGQITQLHIKDIMIIVASFISILAIILGFISFYRSEKNIAIVSDSVNKLENIKISYENLIPRNTLSWLYTEKQLLNIEKRKINSKEIWIVSPDPSDDTGDSPWIKVIKNNLNDGINYYYFAPESEHLAGAIKGLKTVFRKHLNQCYIHILDNDTYEKLPYKHMVIYDPHNEYNETDSFAELETSEKNWWIKLPLSKNNTLLGKLYPFVQQSKVLNEY